MASRYHDAGAFGLDDVRRFTSAEDGQNEARVRAGFWRKVTRVASRIPFATDAVSAYYCALDRSTPVKVRAVLFGALAYFVLPTDAVPDLLPALGFSDDAAILAAALNLLAAHITPAHREAARRALNGLTVE